VIKHSIVLRKREGACFEASVDTNVASKHDSIEYVLAILVEVANVSDVSHIISKGEVKVSAMEDRSISGSGNNGCAEGLELVQVVQDNYLSQVVFKSFSNTFDFTEVLRL
jgi:hypothetical protein